MRISSSPPNGLSIRLTDEEAEALIVALQRQLARRKELVAREPTLAAWHDVVCSMPAVFDDKPVGCALGICAN